MRTFQRSPATRRRGALARAPWVLALLLALAPVHAAQIAPPDLTTCSRLVWATMTTLDNANRTSNYSVLRDIGSGAFQLNNSVMSLGGIFRDLRANRVDVGRAIMIEPTFYLPPNVDDNGVLRLRGGFEFRPRSLRFDLLFVFEQGGWRLHGVSVVETATNAPR
jgi:hypothetical protein